ncbi:MAG TPA: hypothetical protein VFZ23_15240 [Pyrinomonadaceae bacterium]
MRKEASLVAFCIVLSLACSRSTEVANKIADPEPDLQPTPASIKPPIHIHISGMSSSELCDRLISIDTMPTHDPTITDPIYESLIAKGDDAIPCLVEKISDTRPMPDPRYSVPHWQHYKVGDTAVLTLLDIVSRDDSEWENLMIESLSPKYAEEWRTNGIYAYFNYVSEVKNRKELQRWWTKWLKENRR